MKSKIISYHTLKPTTLRRTVRNVTRANKRHNRLPFSDDVYLVGTVTIDGVDEIVSTRADRFAGFDTEWHVEHLARWAKLAPGIQWLPEGPTGR